MEKTPAKKTGKTKSADTMAELSRMIVPLSQVLHHASGAGDVIERARMPVRQLQALVVLSEHGPLAVGELGRKLGIAASTATELNDRLVAASRTERVQGRRDRRKCLIRATDRGLKEADDYRRKVEKSLQRRLGKLGPSEREELLRSFHSIIRILGGGAAGRGQTNGKGSSR